MKIKKLFILMPVAVFSMTSCVQRNVRHDTSDYFLIPNHAKYDSTNGFSILQLSDLHLGTNCDRKVQYAFIQETINQANKYVNKKTSSIKNKVDMIIITGDVFTFGTKEIAQDFVNFMEKQEIDWTLTFGNHDEQCYFSVDWLTGYLNSVSKRNNSYLMFKDLQDDDVFGNANFVISIPDNNKQDQERIYMFDSNRYRYEIGSYGYDYIHYDQIDWYDRCVRFNPGNGQEINPKTVHSTAFFHIPFEEFERYYASAEKGDSLIAKFVKDDDGKELKIKKEGISCPKKNTHLFDKFDELQSTSGVFVGHDHINNYSVQAMNAKNPTENGKMILSFGVKGTDTVYADVDLIGGQVITITGERTNDPTSLEIKNDKQIKIQPILHKYKDLEVK